MASSLVSYENLHNAGVKQHKEQTLKYLRQS